MDLLSSTGACMMMDDNLVEKRKSRRARSLLAGRIIFNNRKSVIDCSVRDISDTGAKLAFAHPVLLPPEFELDIPKRPPFACTSAGPTEMITAFRSSTTRNCRQFPCPASNNRTMLDPSPLFPSPMRPLCKMSSMRPANGLPTSKVSPSMR